MIQKSKKSENKEFFQFNLHSCLAYLLFELLFMQEKIFTNSQNIPNFVSTFVMSCFSKRSLILMTAKLLFLQIILQNIKKIAWA
jgi:hypothetical protein